MSALVEQLYSIIEMFRLLTPGMLCAAATIGLLALLVHLSNGQRARRRGVCPRCGRYPH